jgi:hypothetical protein
MPFYPNINETTVHFENQRRHNNNNEPENNNVTHQDKVKPLDAQSTPTDPILNRRMFSSPPSTLNQPTINSPDASIRRSTISNFGQAPIMLDPLNHLATNYNESATNTSPVEHLSEEL